MVKENNTTISICILRLSSIGDITHIIPIISTLRNEYKRAKITWIIGKTEYQLVKNLDDINFIVVDKTDTINSIMNMRNIFKKENFDIVFHMQKSLRSKFLANVIKSRVNVTFNDINTSEYHVLDHFFAFLEKVNIKKRIMDWQTSKLLSIDKKNTLFEEIDKFKPFITINPFTSERKNNYREWSYDNFATVSEYCKNEYSLNTIILGKTSQSKYNLVSESFKKNSHTMNLINKTTLIEMLSILDQSKFYIGPDSGTLHMARMTDIPIIGLYATSNPHRTGPYQKLEYVIDKYKDALEMFSNKSIKNVKWGERVRDPEAMNLISINDVKNEIRKIISSQA